MESFQRLKNLLTTLSIIKVPNMDEDFLVALMYPRNS
jgi:hypothetical protein